jgi:hypothetical protein
MALADIRSWKNALVVEIVSVYRQSVLDRL